MKVWNLEDDLSVENKQEGKKQQQPHNDEARHMKLNSDSTRSEGNYSGINDSPFSSSAYLESLQKSPTSANRTTNDRDYSRISSFSAPTGHTTKLKRSVSFLQSSLRSHKSSTAQNTLSVSSPVCKLKWRPPSSFKSRIKQENNIDHHIAMLAIATAPAGGANAWGQGHVALWSYHRPFMPLSVVEGHLEGAVTDFIWLDTPQIITSSSLDGHHRNHRKDETFMVKADRNLLQEQLGQSNQSSTTKTAKRKGRNDSTVKNIHPTSEEVDIDLSVTAGTWQHVSEQYGGIL